jgi:hypothetical protein
LGGRTPIDDSGKGFRLHAKVRLIEAIRDALGEAEAYVDGKCSVERVRDAPRKEAEHLDEVGWYTRAQHFLGVSQARCAQQGRRAVSKDLAAGRYFSGLRAGRMMRTVMRVSVQSSISAAQMSANSINYVTSVFIWDGRLAARCLARVTGFGAH